MEKPTFIKACLSGVRVIMSIIRVPMVELLCQTVMRSPLVLNYLLSGVRGRLRPCLVVAGIKCRRFLRT
jgi:hypothetical protein